AIEVHAAELAARHATQAQLDSLEAALQAMADAPDEDAFTAADMRFHHGITEASGNRMIRLLVEGMAEPLEVGRRQSLRGYLQGAPDLDGLIAEHRAVFDRIAARDGSCAARAMRKHLGTTRRDLLRAFSRCPRPRGPTACLRPPVCCRRSDIQLCSVWADRPRVRERSLGAASPRGPTLERQGLTPL